MYAQYVYALYICTVVNASYIVVVVCIFRTFLESEVTNTALRKDLYDKMVALDPNAPTPEERMSQSITKLRYMQVHHHTLLSLCDIKTSGHGWL